ncbi:hypothetical protein D3C81_1266080 [compost metagenome]
MVRASYRDHGTQPPAAFVLESLAGAAVLRLCRASQIPKSVSDPMKVTSPLSICSARIFSLRQVLTFWTRTFRLPKHECASVERGQLLSLQRRYQVCTVSAEKTCCILHYPRHRPRTARQTVLELRHARSRQSPTRWRRSAMSSKRALAAEDLATPSKSILSSSTGASVALIAEDWHRGAGTAPF